MIYPAPFKKAKSYLFKSPHYFFALGCGSGLLSPAPGTWGTLFALLPYCLMARLPLSAYGFIVLLGFLYGCFICGKTAKALGVHDHSSIVWDEFVGLWITLFAVPFSWQWVLLGFGLFRLFDIVKPWPIRWLDRRVKSGFGIMIDDVLAGAFSGLILQVVVRFF